MESKEDELRESMKNTPMRPGTLKVPPKIETAQEEQLKVPVKKGSVNLAPEPAAEEAIVKVEMVHKTEAEDHPNLQHAEEVFPKKSNV